MRSGQRSIYPAKAELCALDKTPEDTYTKVEIKLITPQKRRTAMTQNTITYHNLTDIYGEQVVLGVWRG